MGVLVDGVWQEQEPEVAKADARAVRPVRTGQTAFRNWVTPDGRPGPTGQRWLPAAAGRYHLYVSLACPWAHRTLIMRALKGLQADDPGLGDALADGGTGLDLRSPARASFRIPVTTAATCTRSIRRADAHYTGRANGAGAVGPAHPDHRQQRISRNHPHVRQRHSSAWARRPGDYYPKPTAGEEIDALNARIYDTLNNGVYKAGFATTQAAYEEAVAPLFDTLDWLEERLSRSRFLCGDTLTEADIRLFTTLVRFDAVYHGHFKCNIRRIVDYRNLWAYTRDILPDPRRRRDGRISATSSGTTTMSHTTDQSNRHRAGRTGAGF